MPELRERLPTETEWQQLSALARKRELLSQDLYFRECWDDVFEIHGPRVVDVLNRVAMLSVKPDAVVGRRMRTILNFAVDHGFLPIAAAATNLTRHSIRELWRYDWHVYTTDRLAFSTLWYTSTDVAVIMLEDVRPVPGLPAPIRLARLKGNALAEKRRPDDLRTVLRAPNRILNFVHVADEPGDTIRELAIFFDRRARRSLIERVRDGLGSDGRAEALAVIEELEARYPEHDLSVDAALDRLQRGHSVAPEALARVTGLIKAGQKVRWDEICSLIDPECVPLWDFICVATNLLVYEREVEPLLPSPDVYKPKSA
jgi:hypothetical protein